MGVLCRVCGFFHHYSSPSSPPSLVAVNMSADTFVKETSASRTWCEEADGGLVQETCSDLHPQVLEPITTTGHLLIYPEFWKTLAHFLQKLNLLNGRNY